MASSATFTPSTTPKANFNRPVDAAGLKGKNALVTGAASGLGAGFATALAEAGCYVTVADLDEAGGQSFCKRLSDKGLPVQFVQTDVTSYPSLLSAFKSSLSFSPTKGIDIVLPCAGLMGQTITNYLPDPSFSDDPAPPPTAVLDVNLQGVYYTAHLALHYFRTHPFPSSTKQLLFISSLLAYIESPLVIDYVASKHAVRGLWRSIRGEAAALGIQGIFRTNIIAPSLVNTPMTRPVVSFLKEQRGFSVAEIEDVVGAGLLALCDESVDGRAIAVFADRTYVDLCDDFEGADGGRESLKLVESGLLGPGPSKSGRFRMMD